MNLYPKKRNFDGRDLSNQVFEMEGWGANEWSNAPPDIDKKGQDFDRCSFVGANLSGSTFKNLYLRGCDFTGANMVGVTMHNCNTRESRFVNAILRDAVLTDNNMVRCDFTGVEGNRVDFTDTDLRMSNFRNAKFPHADFTNCWLKGVAMRGTHLEHAKIHDWMINYTYQYKIMEPDTICYAWKLTQQDGYGIYHPKIKYYVGLEADAEQQETGFKELKTEADGRGGNMNTGIAVAPIDWVLKEWNMLGANPFWKLFLVSFKAGDVINAEGIAKFNVKKMKVEKEYPIAKFYEEMKD